MTNAPRAQSEQSDVERKAGCAYPNCYCTPEDTCSLRDDPTPWCHICGATKKAECACPPRAEND